MEDKTKVMGNCVCVCVYVCVCCRREWKSHTL